MDILSKDLFLQFLKEKNIILVCIEKTKSGANEFVLPDGSKQRDLLLKDVLDCMNAMYFSYEDFALAMQQVFAKHSLMK
ncbi:MAG: hypothetical protein IJV77_05425 [Clostridia bacterium]|nr:hypothetical protein [Clostridia bacterium]